MQDNSANRQTLSMEHYLFYHATPLVKIVVGGLTEPERIFHVHEGLLVLRSDYFKSALHKHWASGVEKEVHLPEESAQAFSAFARWIYNDLDLVPDDYLHAVKAYVLGEKILAPAFQDALVNEMEDNLLDAVYNNAVRAIDINAEGSESRDFEPISMEQVVELAAILYEGTSRFDDRMTDLLVRYVVARMHNHLMIKPWKADDMRVLLDNGLHEFLDAESGLMSNHPHKHPGQVTFSNMRSTASLIELMHPYDIDASADSYLSDAVRAEPDVFEKFAKYMYNSEDIGPRDVDSLLPAYLLGVSIMADSFKERIADAIKNELRGTRTMSVADIMDLVEIVYANTSRGDTLRQIVVDHHQLVQNYTWNDQDANPVNQGTEGTASVRNQLQYSPAMPLHVLLAPIGERASTQAGPATMPEQHPESIQIPNAPLISHAHLPISLLNTSFVPESQQQLLSSVTHTPSRLQWPPRRFSNYVIPFAYFSKDSVSCRFWGSSVIMGLIEGEGVAC
ncbi:hypothetical protein G7Y79_00021g049640 [Physcia stellaris]|nr:hypothetical protein G7Y79_00021g049640 [Physcia stellaris]